LPGDVMRERRKNTVVGSERSLPFTL
jgi:hypothetical protein